MRFVNWFEESLPKRVLLLVHPECIAERAKAFRNPNIIKDYHSKLSQAIPQYDLVITHGFLSSRYDTFNLDQPLPGEREFINFVRSNTKYVFNPKDVYGTSFQTILPDFLIENPGSIVEIGGGYCELCVRDTLKVMYYQLRDTMSELGVKVVLNTKLLFERHPGTNVENEPNPQNALRGNSYNYDSLDLSPMVGIFEP